MSAFPDNFVHSAHDGRNRLDRTTGSAWPLAGGADVPDANAAHRRIEMPVGFDRGPMGSHMTIGRILRRMRDDRHISQTALASMVGVDTSYISKLESGRLHTPSPNVIARIAEVLNIDGDLLFGFAGAISPALAEKIARDSHAHRFIQQLMRTRLSSDQWEELFVALERIRHNDGA